MKITVFSNRVEYKLLSHATGEFITTVRRRRCKVFFPNDCFGVLVFHYCICLMMFNIIPKWLQEGDELHVSNATGGSVGWTRCQWVAIATDFNSNSSFYLTFTIFEFLLRKNIHRTDRSDIRTQIWEIRFPSHIFFYCTHVLGYPNNISNRPESVCSVCSILLHTASITWYPTDEFKNVESRY